jgi:hypothetical protein
VGPLCERTVRAEAKPAPALVVSRIRGTLELARGHDGGALAAFRTAERLADPWCPALSRPLTRIRLLQALVRLGELEQAEQVLVGLALLRHLSDKTGLMSGLSRTMAAARPWCMAGACWSLTWPARLRTAPGDFRFRVMGDQRELLGWWHRCRRRGYQTR